MASIPNMTLTDHIKFFIEDPAHVGDFDRWSLMESPWKIAFTAITYLAFVLNIGPRFMECRKPLNVKYFLVFYNFAMAAFSAWLVFEICNNHSVMDDYFRRSCHFTKYKFHPSDLTSIDVVMWLYMASKIVELTDTIMFIVRKKQSQVTFLHVYHHLNMVVFTWIFVKYNRNVQTVFIALCNSAIHAVMYFYYMLSALGQPIQKYLWWKKYLTALQMVQFILIILYYSWLIANSCDGSKNFTIFSLFNTASFYFLFSRFYKNSYNNKEKLKSN